MNRLGKVFEGRKALIAFVTAGDPDLEATRAICPVLEESGADLIELGTPSRTRRPTDRPSRPRDNGP
jgi:Tryptophan synthase alpha chain